MEDPDLRGSTPAREAEITPSPAKRHQGEYDMSLVAPARKSEVARRIAILRNYLRAPSRQGAEEGAEQIGIGLVAFYNLAKAWKNAPRPENVAGSGRPRHRRSTMTEAQLTIVDEAIAIAFHQSAERIVDLAFRLADAARIELPARNIVRRRVDRTKPAAIPASAIAAGADLVLDECVVDIPVWSGGRVVRPLCSVLIDARSLARLGLHLSLGLPSAQVAAACILDAVRSQADLQRSADRHPQLDLHFGHTKDWDFLKSALKEEGVEIVPRPLTARSSGEALVGVLGSTPGIRFMPRLLLIEDRFHGARSRTGAMTIEEADEMLRGRFAVDARRASVPLYRCGGREAFARSLARVANQEER